MDESPSDSLRSHHQVWGVASDSEAETLLCSFAAYSMLSTEERLGALRMRDTYKRLAVAQGSLQLIRNRLVAELAVRQAMSSSK